MGTIDESYAVLGRLVCEDMVYLDPGFSFGMLCRMLGVPRAEMDAMLERELGLDGDSLFASLRAAFPGHLERKYGLKCFFQDL